MTVRQALLIIFAYTAGFAATTPTPVDAAAFTCPETTVSDGPRNTPALSELFSGASDTTVSNRLGELMTDLRKSGMKPALVVDHLIGAYCSLVAADGTLSDKQKADRVRQFARRVTELAYVPADSDEVEVLVTVPVAPTLLGQVDQAAGRSGLSRDAWLERAIKQQLTIP
jgi:hypothetical protein